ncbi:hypothetical protein VTI28DRAFT_7421 [Corynascus sepedonium]
MADIASRDGLLLVGAWPRRPRRFKTRPPRGQRDGGLLACRCVAQWATQKDPLLTLQELSTWRPFRVRGAAVSKDSKQQGSILFKNVRGRRVFGYVGSRKFHAIQCSLFTSASQNPGSSGGRGWHPAARLTASTRRDGGPGAASESVRNPPCPLSPMVFWISVSGDCKRGPASRITQTGSAPHPFAICNDCSPPKDLNCNTANPALHGNWHRSILPRLRFWAHGRQGQCFFCAWWSSILDRLLPQPINLIVSVNS